MIRDIDWYNVAYDFQIAEPFNHAVIDNFFMPEVAEKIANEFPDFDTPFVNDHNSPLEIKKTLNHWDRFPAVTYRAFSLFGRPDFIDNMKTLSGIQNLHFLN